MRNYHDGLASLEEQITLKLQLAKSSEAETLTTYLFYNTFGKTMLQKIKQLRIAAWHFRHSIKLLFVGSITSVESSNKMIALTFDDGPHPQFTPKLLDLLSQNNATATFFVTGDQAKLYPEIIQRIVDENHTLGCHSWTHTSFPLLSLQKQYSEIKQWQEMILPPNGAKFFRPPFGNQSRRSNLLASLMGYKTIMWSGLAEDWLDHSSQVILEKLEAKMQAGAILLLHDHLHDALEESYLDREPTLTAVEQLLEKYSDEYQFVSVQKLLNSANKVHKKLSFSAPNKEFLSNLSRTDTTNTY